MSVFTPHRYYIWADRMRTHFDELISKGDFDKAGSFLYMSYWYGGLYVVIEGWQEQSLSDAVIDATLQSPNVQLLRRYRNGVFHFKKGLLRRKVSSLYDRFVGSFVEFAI